MYTLSCSCQGVVLPTITEAAPGCQSYGPCDTLSCATEIATWTVPCPTTYVSTESIKKGGCATIWSTVTGTTSCAPPAGTPCTTPYCVEQVDFTVDCDCTDVVSTTTVGCPTTCDIPCPTTSYSYSYTDCTTATTTGEFRLFYGSGRLAAD